MSLIEQKLHEIHSEARRHKSELAPEVVGVAKELPKAFVRVTMVTEGSPSALAVSVCVSRVARESDWSVSYVHVTGSACGGQYCSIWFRDSCKLHWA